MSMIIHEGRTKYYEASVSVQGLRSYHVSEQEIAGLWGTETWHPPNFSVPRHSHDFASFYFLLDGSLTEFGVGNQREIGAGSIVFTPPGEIHGDLFHDSGGRCFLVELSADWMARLSDSGFDPKTSIDIRDGEMTRLATKLFKEFRYTDSVTALSVEGLALEILVALSRQTMNESEAHRPGWLRDAKDLLHDRFAETVSLKEVAEQVAVHPVRLARAFRRHYGCSLGEYQRRLRVEYASYQLVTTRRPLSSIAATAGFADQAHFSRVFKKETGLTPAKYRTTFALS